MRLRYTLPALADLTSFWTISLIAPRRELGASIPEFARSPVCSFGIRWLARRPTTSPFDASRRHLIRISSSTRRPRLKSSFTRCATVRAILPTRCDRSEFSQNHRPDPASFGAAAQNWTLRLAPRRSFIDRGALLYIGARESAGAAGNLHSALFGLLVGDRWKMTLKVHSLVQDSYDFDRHSWRHPVHQEVTSAPTVPRDVEGAKT